MRVVTRPDCRRTSDGGVVHLDQVATTILLVSESSPISCRDPALRIGQEMRIEEAQQFMHNGGVAVKAGAADRGFVSPSPSQVLVLCGPNGKDGRWRRLDDHNVHCCCNFVLVAACSMNIPEKRRIVRSTSG